MKEAEEAQDAWHNKSGGDDLWSNGDDLYTLPGLMKEDPSWNRGSRLDQDAIYNRVEA